MAQAAALRVDVLAEVERIAKPQHLLVHVTLWPNRHRALRLGRGGPLGTLYVFPRFRLTFRPLTQFIFRTLRSLHLLLRFY